VDSNTVRRRIVSFSSGDSDMRDRPRSGRPCTAASTRNEGRLNQRICANRRLRPGNFVRSCMSDTMCWKRLWQRWNIAKFVRGGFHRCSHRSIRTTECKSVSTCWTVTTTTSQSVIAAVRKWVSSAGAHFY
jgi:hypothetical protein